MNTHMNRLVFVDVEASGKSPYSGVMTEFGAVHFVSRETFHGKLWLAEPSKENPAIPEPIALIADPNEVMTAFANWLKTVSPEKMPIFVSDNPAYDFQWINYYFDRVIGDNPFGHSARRIGDFAAGLKGQFLTAQNWKKLRVTKHNHNPVNDAMGNVEAFEKLLELAPN